MAARASPWGVTTAGPASTPGHRSHIPGTGVIQAAPPAEQLLPPVACQTLPARTVSRPGHLRQVRRVIHCQLRRAVHYPGALDHLW